MYGLIIDNIATYIKEKYGEATWTEVKFVAGIAEDSFIMDGSYSEGLSHKIIWACHDVTGDSVEDLLRDIGRSFYKFLAKYEFNKILRVLGRTFPQFLNGLDNLHEYLRFTFPKLKPPSFYCEHESRTGLTLHYRSKRKGFIHYVQGQILNIAKELFQTEVEIELLDIETDINLEHIIMRLHFNNVDFGVDLTRYSTLSVGIADKIKIPSDIFFDIFPFIIVFNRGMRIRNIGIGLLRVMSNLIGKKINTSFVLMRPFIRFRWEEVMLYSNNIFELMSAETIRDDELGDVSYKQTDPTQMAEERHRMNEAEKSKYLTLKGQMFYMEEWESICFVGIPVMNNLHQMYSSGLFINDFALHDSSRDLVLASTQQSAEMKLLHHQEAQKTRNMRDCVKRLKRERKLADRLMFKALPTSISEKLKEGTPASKFCEKYDSLTVMFINFAKIAKSSTNVTPVKLIDLFQSCFAAMDKIIRAHGTEKVKTLSYNCMIICGAPRKTDHDVEYILDCASEMIDVISKIPPVENLKALELRAGVHTGPAVTGVIGVNMPQFCVFGETVSIASYLEQYSQGKKILVSEQSKTKLEKFSPNTYFFDKKKNITHKERKVKASFVEGREGDPRPPSVLEKIEEDEDSDDDLLFEEDRQSPTTMAEAETSKKVALSFIPVLDK